MSSKMGVIPWVTHGQVRRAQSRSVTHGGHIGLKWVFKTLVVDTRLFNLLFYCPYIVLHVFHDIFSNAFNVLGVNLGDRFACVCLSFLEALAPLFKNMYFPGMGIGPGLFHCLFKGVLGSGWAWRAGNNSKYEGVELKY